MAPPGFCGFTGRDAQGCLPLLHLRKDITMGIVEDKIRDLQEREKKILKMGGEKAIAKEREIGKLTARERLDILFDSAWKKLTFPAMVWSLGTVW